MHDDAAAPRCGIAASARMALGDTATMGGKDALTALNIKALREEIAHYCALGARVIDQARRRVLNGEQVATSEKIYSIFEPHTDLIKRGKARTSVEFGHKVFLAESAKGLIPQYDVLKGNPVDEVHVAPSLRRHRVLSAAPRSSTAPIAASSARTISPSARGAASRWCAFRSVAAARRRNAKLTNDRRPSNKASAFVPASRGGFPC
jgi:hypothetical protein